MSKTANKKMKKKATQKKINVTFIITKIPESTPSDANIYVAGDFNGWFPDIEKYRLKQNKNGTYQITVEVEEPVFEYKFTRGSWDTAECGKNGEPLPNRKFHYNSGTILKSEIQHWEDKRPTASENVQILDENFYMPQLDRKRRIWLCLPPDYNHSDKRYPVIYMQDGQNLFDELTAFEGEWAVDKTLNAIFQKTGFGAIVVGIDNGGTYRNREYLPWRYQRYPGEEGDLFARFIAQTLKPYIDKQYRTKAGRENTVLFGSSFGALISFYTALKYQHLFGKVGAFSPSFWAAPDKLLDFVEKTGKKQTVKMCFLVGLKEAKLIMDSTQKILKHLRLLGFSDDELKLIVRYDGEHKEWFWRREFSEAIKWLFDIHNQV